MTHYHIGMGKSFIKIIVTFFIFLSISLEIVYATDFKPLIIDFESVLEQAKIQSYDLKIADFDIFISKQGIRTYRSEYFPKINISAGTEYTKNFRDYTTSTVSVVGDAFINPYTRYQTLMGITLTYNVFDFGLRKDKVDLAKEDVVLKELLAKEQHQELELTLIDTYCKLYITKKQIELNEQILELARKNLEYKMRLFEAKEISKTELNEQIIEVQKYEKRIYELKSLAQESLNWITFYTKKEYNLERLVIKEFKTLNYNPMEFNDYTKSLTWQIQEEEIKKKELALKIAKKNNLPKVNAYSRYYLYGTDHSSYKDTMSDFGPSNYTIGGTIYMPVFDGFKNNAEIQTAQLELQQQLVKRDKAIAQLMTRLATMRSNLIYLNNQIDSNIMISEELGDKQKNIKRLVDKKISTPIELNESKIQILENEIELEKNKATTKAITNAIHALTNY